MSKRSPHYLASHRALRAKPARAVVAAKRAAQQPPAEDTPEYLTLLVRLLLHPSDASAPQDVLPAMTSSSAVDLRLFALVGLLLNQFVVLWYLRVLDDQELVMEIVGNVAHLTRDLEERVRRVDAFVLADRVGAVLEEHVEHLRRGDAPREGDRAGAAFQLLTRHLAFVNGEDSLRAYLSAVAGVVMENSLPTDLCASSLAASFLDSALTMVLGLVVDKLSQDYFWWEAVGSACDVLQRKEEAREPPKALPVWTRIGRVFRLVSSYVGLAASGETPLASNRFFLFVATLTELLHRRPLVYAGLQLFPWTSPRVDGVLVGAARKAAGAVLTENTVCTVVSKLRRVLFPTDTTMGPPREEPSSTEKAALVEQTAAKLGQVLGMPGRLLFVESDYRGFLHGFDRKEANAVLVVSLLDVLVATLYPAAADPLCPAVDP